MKISFFILLSVFLFCIFNFIPQLVSAGSSANFQIQIYYAEKIENIDTTIPSIVTITNPNNSSLEINTPDYVLTSGDEVETTIHSIPKASVIDSKQLPIGKLGAEVFYNISFKKTSDETPVHVFDKDITLDFSYENSDISGINESTLGVYRWNGSAWSLLTDSVVDENLNKITATSSNFSYFAILGDALISCGDSTCNGSETCSTCSTDCGICPPSCGDSTCNGSETCSTCSADCGSCPSGGGGGGGGGGGVYIPPVTSAIFSGRAYPKSTITLLKDAQVAATTITDANANFSLTLSGLAGGNYIFSVYSEDSKGVRSSLLTFPISVTSGATTSVGGIFIAPTIAVDKKEVKRGDDIQIFGQSTPNSEITISVNSDEEIFSKIQSDKNGVYLYNFDTALLEMGDHSTRSKVALNGNISSFSKVVSFVVGTKNVYNPITQVVSRGDVNNDKKINLVDFSIAAYWYKKASPPANIDLNNDGKVDLVDFSIMAYYWTG